MPRRAITGLLTIVTGAVLTNATVADIINVPDPVNGIFTIQDGIDAAVDGDEVIVVPVPWFESINLLGKALELLLRPITRR